MSKQTENFVENDNLVQDDIQDISLDVIRKKKFRIDGDNDRILELNTSDLMVLNRIEDSYPRLVKLGNKASHLQVSEQIKSEDGTIDESIKIKDISQTLREIDSEMRDIIDYIFDADVSAKCVPHGSMFDPFNGELTYEHVMDTIAKLYETNLDKEFEAMKKRVQKHTSKYTGKN